MFSDIFSSFDQSLSITLPLMLLPVAFFISSHGSSSLFSISELFMTTMTQQVNSTKSKEILPGKILLFTLFYFLMMLNLSGLWPYTASITSHLWFSISLGLVFWGSLLIAGAVKFPKETVAHLYPTGAPMALGPFLILIETVSIMIRPITLSVRLVANMSAGHIVIAMIGMYPLKASMVLLNAFYFLFEVGVSIIQGYIFFLLVSLYSNDSFLGVSHEKIWVSKKDLLGKITDQLT